MVGFVYTAEDLGNLVDVLVLILYLSRFGIDFRNN